MIDGHIHLERGLLTKEYVLKIVEEAKRKGLKSIQILDHTHRFKEFKPLYSDLNIEDNQIKWLKSKFKDSISDYITLIEECREIDYGINVYFGLEVCHSINHHSFIKQELSKYKFDFIVGSVHSVFNYLYDMPFSENTLFKYFSVDEIYNEYYRVVFDLLKSGLYTQIGHVDTIKMYNLYPSFSLVPIYEKIADLAKENNIVVENNFKVHYAYKHEDKGLNGVLIDTLNKKGVLIITSSDAHEIEEIGRF